METIGGILIFIAGLTSFVCWIMVLIKMFKTESSPLMGIIGIICNLWAFIWGWMNAGKLGIKNLMLIWTAAIVLTAVAYALVLPGALEKAKLQQQQQSIQYTP